MSSVDAALDATRSELYANGKELHDLANAHATEAALEAKLSVMRFLHGNVMEQLHGGAEPSAAATVRRLRPVPASQDGPQLSVVA
jgi:hypothetical protein